MKRLLSLLLVLPLLARAEDVLPKGTDADRYKAIWERAPFTVASSADEPKATWVLAGLAESDTDPVVYLLNKDTQERVTVTREANAKGFSLVSIRYDADPLRTSAEVRVPGQTQPLEVRFDPALLVVTNPAPTPSNPAASAANSAPATDGNNGEERPWV